MFSKISRYRSLPNVVTVDAKGRALASKSLRLLPEAPGTFLHTVEEADRLDHVAYKYYEQPRNWWHIVDANPAFLSPLALLGSGPLATVQIPLTWVGTAPTWSDLLRVLQQTVGVEVAVMGTPEEPYATTEIMQGHLAFDIAPALATELDASTRAQEITPTLAAALLAKGVTFSAEVRLEKPDAATWRSTDLPTRQVYTFRLFEDDDLLNVYESKTCYDWVVTVTYNNVTVSTKDILDLLEDQDFSAGPPVESGRVGKSIVIPPRVVLQGR